MTSADKPAGFLITQGRIALILSIFALMGFFYQVSKFGLDLQFRTAALEEKFNASERTQIELNSKLDRLGTVISELNITLREVQVRQEVKP